MCRQQIQRRVSLLAERGLRAAQYCAEKHLTDYQRKKYLLDQGLLMFLMEGAES